MSPDAQARLEAFRRDILNVLVHQLRVNAWVIGYDHIPKIWASMNLAPSDQSELYNPDWSTADWKLVWADVATLDAAIYLDNMFLYGHFGMRDSGWEPMEDGTGYTWIALLLLDLAQSHFMSEWALGYGGEGLDSVTRCLEVAELANARLVLETGEPFCFSLSARGKDEEATSDALTIRQMALLAGMEEMSVRAAANPKRPNPLQTFSEGGRTRVAPTEAKRWLESKSRYIPIQLYHSGRDTNLGKRAFSCLEDLTDTCLRQLRMLEVSSGEDGYPITDPKVAEFFAATGGTRKNQTRWSDAQLSAALAEPAFVTALAQCLQYPAELLALRTREVLAKVELQSVQQRLRALSAGA